MQETITRLAVGAMERGWLPDALVRMGIRRLCRGRLRELYGTCEARQNALREFIAAADSFPIAPLPEKANEQHYEVLPEFFEYVLGPRLKYSSCLWDDSCRSLADAEIAALGMTCERARFADGLKILELGCGWGSLTLWMAEKYPNAQITAVSNSALQRCYIEEQLVRRGLNNVQVITADMNSFEPGARFDRVVSIEMFEHMRNHRLLMRQCARWLEPHGLLFIHIFCHRECPYEFATEGAGNWMGRYFFTGGIMPSESLLLHYQDELVLTDQWRWSGRHYQKTADAWLENMDQNREAVTSLMGSTYGTKNARCWLQRWRIFFMACAELFGYRGGEEWWVAHYLFEKRAQPASLPQRRLQHRVRSRMN